MLARQNNSKAKVRSDFFESLAYLDLSIMQDSALNDIKRSVFYWKSGSFD